MSEWKEHAPPLLVEFAAHIEAVLRELDRPPDQADHVAFEIVRRFAEAAGGTTLYIPKVDQLLRHERDAAIYDSFTGANVQALARKYGISEVWIYAIIRRQRQLRRAQTEPALPGFLPRKS